MFIDSDDTKAELLANIVPGASNVSKIRTNMPASVGKIGKPVTELTKYEWMIISPGQEDHSNVYLTQSTTHDCGLLYLLDVLGLDNTSRGDQYTVYIEFREKLQ